MTTPRPMPARISRLAPIGSLLKRPRGEGKIKRGAPSRQTDASHLAAVRLCPCIKCGLDEAGEAAHIRLNSAAFGKRQAIGKKPDDKWTLPLCRCDEGALHKVGELAFFADLGINPLIVCEALYRASPDVARMRLVVVRAIMERPGRTMTAQEEDKNAALS